MFKCGRFEASFLLLWVGIYAKMFQVYYTSRNLLSRFISFEITPAKLKGGLPAPLSPMCDRVVGSGLAQQAMFSEGSDPANPLKQTFELY